VGAAALTFTGTLDLRVARLTSTTGTLTLASGGTLAENGLLDVGAGTVVLGGDFRKSGGSLLTDNATLELQADLVVASDDPLSLKTVALNQRALMLGEPTPSLTLSEQLILDNPNSRIVQGAAELHLNGGIRLDSGGTLRLTYALDTGSGSIQLNGGLLAVDNSTTLASSLRHEDSSTIEVAADATLTYSGAGFGIGSHTLTLQGGGSFANQENITLDDPDGQLTLLGITVDNVTTSADSKGVVVDNASTVNHLAVSDLTPLAIASGETLSGKVTVVSGGTLQLSEAGTLASDVTMTGGTLAVAESLTISGTLVSAGAATVEVADGKTLSHSGGGLDLGPHTLTLSGGGTFDNTDNLTLNDPASLLVLSEGTTLSRLRANAPSDAGKGLQITGKGNFVSHLHLSDNLSVNSTDPLLLDDLTVDAALTLSSNQDVNTGTLWLLDNADLSLGTTSITLTVTDPVTVGNAQTLRNSAGNFAFDGGSTLLSGGELVAQGGSVSGNLNLSGGQLTVVQNSVFSGDLTHSESSMITVAVDQELNYGGAALEIGAKTLTLAGGGYFRNDNPIRLDQGSSELHLQDIEIDTVAVSA
ncbi:MAG: hypothetical protein QF922_07435, partial [SAR324 cluster bacterium]|nr:hypothetical protein [SAR324 cluster bacterium]